MKKYLLTLFMVLALTACDNKKDETQASNKPVIKIGAILPLTGSQATMGAAAKAGMQKALDDKDKSSLHYDYQLVFEDNQAKLPSMPAIANKLIMQDKVNAIGVITSPMARIIAPIADQHQILIYAFSIEEEKYERFGKYAFIQGMSTESVAQKLVEIFVADKIDNISLYMENIGVLGSLTAYLEQKLSKSDIKFEVNTFNPGERDFRIAIEKSKNKEFMHFLQAGFPPERDIILKQLSETGITNENIYSFGLDLGKPLKEYSNIKAVSYNQGTDEFMEEIQQKYSIDNIYGSAEFYDFVNMIIDTYETLYKEGHKPTAEEVTAYIHNKKEFPCMSGQCVVHPNGFIINAPIIRVYKDGKWVTIEE